MTTQIDFADVAKNPEKYGFKWELRPLEKNDVQVCPQAPLPKQTGNLDLFIATFGTDRVQTWLFSTSLTVTVQRVLRDACATDLRLRTDLDALKLMAVKTMFGQKADRVTVVTVTVKKFLANDGETEFDSLEDVKEFNRMLAEAEARIAADPSNQ